MDCQVNYCLQTLDGSLSTRPLRSKTRSSVNNTIASSTAILASCKAKYSFPSFQTLAPSSVPCQIHIQPTLMLLPNLGTQFHLKMVWPVRRPMLSETYIR